MLVRSCQIGSRGAWTVVHAVALPHSVTPQSGRGLCGGAEAGKPSVVNFSEKKIITHHRVEIPISDSLLGKAA